MGFGKTSKSETANYPCDSADHAQQPDLVVLGDDDMLAMERLAERA